MVKKIVFIVCILLNILYIKLYANNQINPFYKAKVQEKQSKVYKGSVKGYEYKAYPLIIQEENQQVKIHLKTSSTSLYAAIIGTGDSSDYDNVEHHTFDLLDWNGTLPKGTYEVRVYLYRSAARKNKTASYTLSITQ